MKQSAAPKDLKKLEAAARREKFEQMLLQQIKAVGLPRPIREHLFHPTRRWRFDMAWVEFKVAVEVDGGVHSQGRHTRGSGYEEDCVKMGEAALLGWKVFRFSTGQVRKGVAIDFLERALQRRSDAVAQLMARHG